LKPPGNTMTEIDCGICARNPDGAPNNPASAARNPTAHLAVARVMDIIASAELLARLPCGRPRAAHAVCGERYHPLPGQSVGANRRFNRSCKPTSDLRVYARTPLPEEVPR